MRTLWLAAAAFALCAALSRWWIAPAFELLPGEYAAELHYAATLRTHQTPSSPVEEFGSKVLRRDQVLTSNAGAAVIQGDAHWLTPSGALIFETINTYGVDRRTRQNVAGFGDQDRQGQYLFPPHVQQQPYHFWDSLYGGAWVATFDHAEPFRGVDVYVFDTRADGIDETAGYDALPDVPEKYRALTNGKGRIRVEPVSGTVVDLEDTGASHFVDAKTGQRIGEPICQWIVRFTEPTIEAQVQLATATRRRMLALEVWLPLVLAAAGLFTATVCAVGRRAS